MGVIILLILTSHVLGDAENCCMLSTYTLQYFLVATGFWAQCHPYIVITSIKNEVGCRDDTVPKTVDTRRHCGEE